MTVPYHPPRPPQLSDWHFSGVAAVYVRQSTMEQVRDNMGSGMAQMALAEILKAWGYPDERIRVYDEDMGQTGTTTKGRHGFQAMTEEIRAGVIRVVMVMEISRLGRDALELAKFLGLCEWKRILLLERGIPRDLGEIGDWTLVNIERVLAEQENRRRSQRIRTGMLAKARAGQLPHKLPAGLDRGPNGEGVKTADPAVREIIDRVWREALEGLSAWGTVRRLLAEERMLPARGPRNSIRWVTPSRSGVFRILKNPLYAGLLVVWKRRMERGPDGPRLRYTAPEDREWITAKVEPYITPEEYWRVQALLASRNSRSGGVPLGQGEALCARLVWCVRCSRRLHVGYYVKGKPRPIPFYSCRGGKGMRDVGPACMWVSGQMLDRVIEEIVLNALQCPSPAVLRRAIQEENSRREAAGRLLHAEVRRAEAEVAAARARVEEARPRSKNPKVVELYEDELEQALRRVEKVKRRAAAATPPSQLIDATPEFVGAVVDLFRSLPRLWQSGRLGPQERRAVVAKVVSRIEIPEKGPATRVRVTLHGGTVLERILYGPKGRRQLVETLAAQGLDYGQIAAELDRRGVRNKFGRPLDVATVKQILRYQKRMRGRDRRAEQRATEKTLRALWALRLPQAEIAQRMNAEGLENGSGKPWTVWTVLHWAKRLGLPPRWQGHREALRSPLKELVDAGWDDSAIAEEFNSRGPGSFSGTSWTASRVQRMRRVLEIHQVPGFPRDTATKEEKRRDV